MLLHWKHGGHTRYAYEVIELISSINAAASPRIAHELLWCRVVNKSSGAGNNIPADLFLEHLNRTLKVFVSSTGPNVSVPRIMLICAFFKLRCALLNCPIYLRNVEVLAQFARLRKCVCAISILRSRKW